MQKRNDYRHIGKSESVTATSDGVALDRTVPLHLVTTNGDQDVDIVTLANGVLAGERHYIMLVSLGHANDSLRVTPASRPTGDYISFRGTKAVGIAVELVWDGTQYQICGGNAEPFWDAAA